MLLLEWKQKFGPTKIGVSTLIKNEALIWRLLLELLLHFKHSYIILKYDTTSFYYPPTEIVIKIYNVVSRVSVEKTKLLGL